MQMIFFFACKETTLYFQDLNASLDLSFIAKRKTTLKVLRISKKLKYIDSFKMAKKHI